MKKIALRFLAAGALVSPLSVYALGLGDIHLNSALNQTFNADIDLVSATADELSTLQVALASSDTFQRYGLDRPEFLSNFSLRVDNSKAARPVIRVSSSSVINEPFINLLVEINWSGGRLLREYTLLLDPPVLESAPVDSPVIQSPQAGQAANGSTPAVGIVRGSDAVPPAAQSASPPVAESASTVPVRQHPTSYTVKSADSLSKIASGLSHDSQVSLNQTMVALYRANPQAFAGNMNMLRAGSVLRVPPVNEIAAVSDAEALAEITQQHGTWRAGNERVGDQPAAERLRLVPAEQSAAANGQASASQSSSSPEPVNERIKTLESDLAEAKRLLDLKNTELAQMQRQLTPEQSESNAAEHASTSSSAVSSEQSSAAAVVESVPQSVPPAVSHVVQPPASANWLQQLAEHTSWLITAALALIVALLLVLRRRKSVAHQESEGDASAEPNSESYLYERRKQQREVAETEAINQDDTHVHHDATVNIDDPQSASQILSDITISGEDDEHIDQHDAISEADFHLSYGLYDQAAEIIKSAIERQPERHDLKLKLAEIYFVSGNKDAFVVVAQELYATRDLAPVGEWDKVLIMGKQLLPDHPLFAADLVGSSVAERVDVNLEGGEHHVDIELFDAPEGDQSSPLTNHDSSLGSDYAVGDHAEIDFLLDEPNRGVDESPLSSQHAAVFDFLHAPEQGAATVREQLDRELFAADQQSKERTAELALDEIGIDVSGIHAQGAHLDDNQFDESTRVPVVDADQTLADTRNMVTDDRYTLNQDDQAFTATVIPDDTIEDLRHNAGQTGIHSAVGGQTVNLDHLHDLGGFTGINESIQQTSRTEMFDDDFDLDEFEPATMTEVGTKLDLARAYMDMGDPDGARSILKEVLEEGSAGQKLEAERLLSSIG